MDKFIIYEWLQQTSTFKSIVQMLQKIKNENKNKKVFIGWA